MTNLCNGVIIVASQAIGGKIADIAVGKQSTRRRLAQTHTGGEPLTKIPPAPSIGEATLLRDIRAYNLPEPIVDDFKPIPGRDFCFDLAWPPYWLLVEVQGGAWMGKGHTGGKGYSEDCRKLNLAQLLGFTVLWYTTEHVMDATAIDELREFFDKEKTT